MFARHNRHDWTLSSARWALARHAIGVHFASRPVSASLTRDDYRQTWRPCVSTNLRPNTVDRADRAVVGVWYLQVRACRLILDVCGPSTEGGAL
jgi:hypothetical protein